MCADTDVDSSGDVDGDRCEQYTANPSWCMGDFNDDDFVASSMCCVCGGGSAGGPAPTTVDSTCVDGDAHSSGDVDGDRCVDYAANPQWCEGNFDDDDFVASTMCCACGGSSEGRPEPPQCSDTDEGSTGDVDGDLCEQYTANQQWCMGDFGDDDFNAASMCCACGGGSALAHRIY
jgi:hypothetical protein